ncbi:MAG: hypothetical protein GY856_33620 [bacterium]|nr:hypothetical protein [bacterium]
MTSNKNRLAALVRELAASARRVSGPPPSPDELADYTAGELSEAEAERIRDHLTWDGESRRVVQDLASFPDLDPPSEEYRISDQQLQEDWRTLAAQVGLEESGDRPRKEPSPEEAAKLLPFRVPPSRLRVSQALAACFLLACLGLSFWVFQLRRELTAPRTRVHTVQLIPVTEPVRDEPAVPAAAVSPSADGVVWVLELAEPTPYREHSIDVVDDQGELIRSLHPVESNSERFFVVTVPPDYLPAGHYLLRLFGSDGDRRSLVAEYRLQYR